jgi:hypothetical protein
MMTLLASIAGFITSIIPEFIRLKKEKHDKDHELKIIDRQIEYSKISQNNNLSMLGIKRDISEFSALYSTYNTGISWIDAFNGTVRPMLTYCFFGLYVYIKLLQYKLYACTEEILEYVDIIWNNNDQTIFAGIISFYFGQRAFNKLRKNNIKTPK